MLEFIPSEDGVIAMRVSHKIAGSDLDAAMDRLAAAMDRHDKVHLFVETEAIEGVELSGIPAYLARAMPLLGKLNRFGRIAVVADQAWIRTAARIESAMLPLISYRIFEPEERDAALAWVKSGE